VLNLRVTEAPSPFGPLLVVESDRGLVAIEWNRSRRAKLAELLARRLGTDFVLSQTESSPACAELRAYFAGQRRSFDVPVDWSSLRGFQRDVLRALAKVPFGELVTYGDLAKKIGKPGAARAIGGAMAKNPIPIVLPCHRVIASDGSLGGFSGGAKVKQWLQAHEGVEPRAGGWTTRAERRAPRGVRPLAPRTGRPAPAMPAKKRRTTLPPPSPA
jgi:methylated-DNA-[protein]-cysteine S-methyltransferase